MPGLNSISRASESIHCRLSAWPTKGMRPAEHQVACEHHTGVLGMHHQVFGRVGRAHAVDVEDLAAEFERRVGLQPAVGRHQARLFVDPREQLFAAGLQAQLRGVGVQVGQTGALRDDGRPQGLEGLQAVDMVGVVMRDDHVADRLRRHLADRGDQLLGQGGRAERIDHHHARRRDHEACVGDEVAIGGRAQGGFTLHEPDGVGHALGLEGGCRRGRRTEDQPGAEPQQRCREAAQSAARTGVEAGRHVREYA